MKNCKNRLFRNIVVLIFVHNLNREWFSDGACVQRPVREGDFNTFGVESFLYLFHDRFSQCQEVVFDTPEGKEEFQRRIAEVLAENQLLGLVQAIWIFIGYVSEDFFGRDRCFPYTRHPVRRPVFEAGIG